MPNLARTICHSKLKMRLLWVAFALLLYVVHVIQAAVDDDDDGSFTFSCAEGELLAFYNQSSTDYILAQCTPAVICGQAKTCIKSQSPACPAQFQYISGVQETDGSVLFTCCKLSPMNSHDMHEYCDELQVLDQTFTGYQIPADKLKALTDAVAQRAKNSPQQPRHVKRHAKTPLTIKTNLFTDRIESSYATNQFVKSIRRTGKGYTVKRCTIQCHSTTTRTTATPKKANNPPHKKQLVGRGGGNGCFSGDMTVMTQDGQKRMDELHVGDQVLVLSSESDNIFQPIEWFYHRDPDHSIDYINLETKSGRRLSITGNHLIPFVPCAPNLITLKEMDQHVLSASFAWRAKIGACLAIKSQDDPHFIADPIVRISSDRKRGVFSPITSQGTIVVNGMQTSCYSSLENQVVQHSIHSILIKTNRFLQSLWRMVSDGFSPNDSKMEEQDIPTVLGFLLELAKKVLPAHVYQ